MLQRAVAFTFVLAAFASRVAAGELVPERPSCQGYSSLKVIDIHQPVHTMRATRNGAALDAFKQFGVRTIIRYYDKQNESIGCKTLMKDEVDAILGNGFSIAVVFQHKSNDPETFFDKERGKADAIRALDLAEANGQPYGSSIYFGVDGVDEALKGAAYEFFKSKGRDITNERLEELKKSEGNQYRRYIRFYDRFRQYREKMFGKPANKIKPEDMLPFIDAYFTSVKNEFEKFSGGNTAKGYEVAAYGSGLVCEHLLKARTVTKCWLAQSPGWPGTKEFRSTDRWSLRQKLPTACPGWRNPRKPKDVVTFDFNEVKNSESNFGQWSNARVPSKSLPRPTNCP